MKQLCQNEQQSNDRPRNKRDDSAVIEASPFFGKNNHETVQSGKWPCLHRVPPNEVSKPACSIISLQAITGDIKFNRLIISDLNQRLGAELRIVLAQGETKAVLAGGIGRQDQAAGLRMIGAGFRRAGGFHRSTRIAHAAGAAVILSRWTLVELSLTGCCRAIFS